MEGWIKLHRSIIDSAAFDDSDVLKVWIWLLCNVAYDEHDIVYLGKVISLKKGQIVTGRQKMSQQIGMSENKIYRAINILKSLGNISVKSNNRFSLITVENWLKYQQDQQQTEQQTNGKLNSKTNSPITAKQQQNQHNKRNKERKEIKEEKNKKAVALSGDGEEIFIHENSCMQYVVRNGKMYDLQGRELNSAGFPIIDFGLSKYNI
jgi:biotin operon repressor